MNWYKRNSGKVVQAQSRVMVDPATQEWGREKQRRFLVSYDVSASNPDRLQNMSMAVNAILSQNPPLETEALKEYFRKETGRDVYTGGNVEYVVQSISDLLSPSRVIGDSVLIEYSETAGRSILGKLLWSLRRWSPNLIPNILRKDKGQRQGLLYNILMKSGLLPRVEELIIMEMRGILQKAVEWGILSGFNPGEWKIDTKVMGRDVTITPIG